MNSNTRKGLTTFRFFFFLESVQQKRPIAWIWFSRRRCFDPWSHASLRIHHLSRLYLVHTATSQKMFIKSPLAWHIYLCWVFYRSNPSFLPIACPPKCFVQLPWSGTLSKTAVSMPTSVFQISPFLSEINLFSKNLRSIVEVGGLPYALNSNCDFAEQNVRPAQSLYLNKKRSCIIFIDRENIKVKINVF